MPKAINFQNLRNSNWEHHRNLAALIDNHSWKHIFFVGPLFDRYYQPLAKNHSAINDARIHATFATLAHMDYGLSAIHLGMEKR
jgi:hypothetical protein